MFIFIVYINVHGSSLVLWPTILLLPPCPYTMVYKTLTPYNARTLAYKAMTMDDAENIAIEVDSEEVNEDYDEDGTRVFKVTSNNNISWLFNISVLCSLLSNNKIL